MKHNILILHKFFRLTKFFPATAGTYALAMSYSPSGRVIDKRVLSTGTFPTNINSLFGYCNELRPHAPVRVYETDSHALTDLIWDDAGNLGQVNSFHDDAYERSRFLFWTEDSRLHTVVDDRHYSYYAYDHAGERTIKLSGDNNVVDVNAETMHTMGILDAVTIYPSPYMVVSNKGYTKHYYVGSDRLCARVGGGGLVGTIQGSGFPIDQAEVLFEQCYTQCVQRKLVRNDFTCIRSLENNRYNIMQMQLYGFPNSLEASVHFDFTQFTHTIDYYFSHCDSEQEVYFYHGDHLGSASWITDNDGIPAQHLQYLPFGEPFVNQRTTNYNERYTFTGKERDTETGYSYFGARYYDSDLSGLFLSVDPMANKYPDISPYAYCAWNPLKLVDPDGEEAFDNTDGWIVDRVNKTITRTDLDGGDNIQYVQGDGNWMRKESRDDLLNEYSDYTFIDNVQLDSQPKSTKEKGMATNNSVSSGTVTGAIVGGASIVCEKRSKKIFDYDKGTYLGKDGTTKIMKKGKNGGLNGKYKSQIKASAKYLKAGRVCTIVGVTSAIVSMDNTERQYRNGQISQGERWTNHAIDVVGCTPIGCLAPVSYELGKKYGPSTWFNK